MMKRLTMVLAAFLVMISAAGCTRENSAREKNLLLNYGSWEGNVFVSEWGEFSVSAPSGWYKASDDELAAIYAASEEIVIGTGAATKEELAAVDYVYPMMIAKYPFDSGIPDMNTNMIVFYEKLMPINVLLINGRSYLELTKDHYREMNPGYEINGGIEKIRLAGTGFYKMVAEDSDRGLMQVFICRRHAGFIIGFIISGSLDDPSEIDGLIDGIEMY